MSILKEYDIIDVLGEGTFGVVRLGKNKVTGDKFAIKILEKKKIKARHDEVRVKRELDIIKRVNHINVIKIIKIEEDKDNKYIIMEYCEKGELFNHIIDNEALSEMEAAYFYYQLINGLECIHYNGFVHRDLKPENLLINKDNILKIIDFGLSNYFDKTKLLTTPCGSPCYASPEMVIGRIYDGCLSDVWSTGIVLFAMLCGYLPFEDPNNENLYKKIYKCNVEYPDDISLDGVDLMKKILVNKPEERITLQEIKKHPFYLKGRIRFELLHANLLKEVEINYEALNENKSKSKVDINKEGDNKKRNRKNKMKKNFEITKYNINSVDGIRMNDIEEKKNDSKKNNIIIKKYERTMDKENVKQTITIFQAKIINNEIIKKNGENKENKKNNETKENKGNKENKENKESKEIKEYKEKKEIKEIKEYKEKKEKKEIKENKEKKDNNENKEKKENNINKEIEKRNDRDNLNENKEDVVNILYPRKKRKKKEIKYVSTQNENDNKNKTISSNSDKNVYEIRPYINSNLNIDINNKRKERFESNSINNKRKERFESNSINNKRKERNESTSKNKEIKNNVSNNKLEKIDNLLQKLENRKKNQQGENNSKSTFITTDYNNKNKSTIDSDANNNNNKIINIHNIIKNNIRSITSNNSKKKCSDLASMLKDNHNYNYYHNRKYNRSHNTIKDKEKNENKIIDNKNNNNNNYNIIIVSNTERDDNYNKSDIPDSSRKFYTKRETHIKNLKENISKKNNEIKNRANIIVNKHIFVNTNLNDSDKISTKSKYTIPNLKNIVNSIREKKNESRKEKKAEIKKNIVITQITENGKRRFGHISPMKHKLSEKDTLLQNVNNNHNFNSTKNSFVIKVNPLNYTEKKESRNKPKIFSNLSELKMKDKNNIYFENKSINQKISYKRLFLNSNNHNHSVTVSVSNSKNKLKINSNNNNNNNNIPIKNKNISYINIKVNNNNFDKEKTMDNNNYSQRKNRYDKNNDNITNSNNLLGNKSIDVYNSTNNNDYNKKTYHKNINIITGKVYNNKFINRSLNREALESVLNNQKKYITESNSNNLNTQNKYNCKLKKREILKKINENEKSLIEELNKIKNTNNTNKENKEKISVINNNNCNRIQKNYIHRRDADIPKTFINTNHSSITLQKKHELKNNPFKISQIDVSKSTFYFANIKKNNNNNTNTDINKFIKYDGETRNNHRLYISSNKASDNNLCKDLNSLSCNRTYTNFNKQLGLTSNSVDKRGFHNRTNNINANNNYESCFNFHPSYKKRNINNNIQNLNNSNINNQKTIGTVYIKNNNNNNEDNNKKIYKNNNDFIEIKDFREPTNSSKYISNERLVHKGIIKKYMKDNNVYDNNNKYKYLPNNNDNKCNEFNKTQNFYYSYKLYHQNMKNLNNKLSSNSITFKSNDKSIDKNSIMSSNKTQDVKQNTSTNFHNANHNIKNNNLKNIVYSKINPKNYNHVSYSNCNKKNIKSINNYNDKAEENSLNNKKNKTIYKNDNNSFNEIKIKSKEISTKDSKYNNSYQYLALNNTMEKFGQSIKEQKKPENTEKPSKLERLTVNRKDPNLASKSKKLRTAKMENKYNSLFKNNYSEVNRNGNI